MNYEDSIKWINSFQKFGIKLDLDRIKYIIKELGNPQNNYKIIHVAGSNGKGSVCNYLSSILSESGYKVGKYTSPHLQTINERIEINNKKISNNDFANITKTIKQIVDKMILKKGEPTYFELLTSISLQYFKEKKIDYAIIEVGLGGKYDATNIVNPIISIITNISLEHQNILGKKITEIAEQKAGIIKEKIPVFTAAKNNSLKIIKQIAKDKKSNIYVINNSNYKRLKVDIKNQKFQIKGLLKEYIVETKILGKYQGENISLAIKSSEYLQQKDTNITEMSIIKGIKNSDNPGRMEIIKKEPLLLLDGAHNSKGIKLLIDTIKNDFKYNRLIIILAILKDKNIKTMIPPIIHQSDLIITTQSKNNRALDANQLEKIIKKNNKKIIVKTINKIEEAIKYSFSTAKKNDLICITGSLYTVAEARDYLKKYKSNIDLSKYQ
jgi:dihydrofolate synthase/folylpolyglutamate synthase